MTTLYDLVQKVKAEIAGYKKAGMKQSLILPLVRKESCASQKVWDIVESNIVCNICGSIVDVSKKGNLYCTNICWEKPEYKAAIERERAENEAAMESYHGDWGDRD